MESTFTCQKKESVERLGSFILKHGQRRCTKLQNTAKKKGK
jgi:hypothetical protein